MSKHATDGLNKHFEKNLTSREWGRALEALKKDSGGLRNDHHGHILNNGDYRNNTGYTIGNIGDYIK